MSGTAILSIYRLKYLIVYDSARVSLALASFSLQKNYYAISPLRLIIFVPKNIPYTKSRYF